MWLFIVKVLNDLNTMENFACILCKKATGRLITVFQRTSRGSPKDSLIEICGYSVAEFLDHDDLVCSNCTFSLQRFVKFKQYLVETIVRHGSNRVEDNLDLSDFYHITRPDDLQDNLSDILQDVSPHNFLASPSSSHNTMGGSPNNLLMVKSSIPFDQRPDTDMEVANSKYRYSERDTPLLDWEVHRVNMHGSRKRRRGHSWTRRKGSRRSVNSLHRSASRYSRVSRTTTHSRSSRKSVIKIRQQESEAKQKERILQDFIYQNNSLGQFARIYLNQIRDGVFDYDLIADGNAPVIKTRYASKLQVSLMSEFEKLVYECPFESCNQTVYNLEEHTEHRVKVHNEMALFWCEQCKFSYLSQEHLDKHEDRKHFEKFLMYCIYCSEEFTNKRKYVEHLDEHLIHSFPCIYCDKFFLKKQMCDNHIREQHPGRKRKIKRIKPQSILDRIDKYPAHPKEPSSQPNDALFVVRVLCQIANKNAEEATSEDDPIAIAETLIEAINDEEILENEDQGECVGNS